MKTCNIMVSQNPPPNRRVEKLSTQQESLQLELFQLPQKRQKPQISSVPGVSAKDPYRYRVMVGGKAIASELTADAAVTLANLLKRKRLKSAIEFLKQWGSFSEEVRVFLLSAIRGGK